MGASWGSDGRIVFGTNIGLQLIPGDGGKPELITRIDSTKESGHHLPCVLPGGKALVFTVKPHGLGFRGHDITPDGKRFLIRALAQDTPAAVTQLNFVQNWFEELKRLVPGDKR